MTLLRSYYSEQLLITAFLLMANDKGFYLFFFFFLITKQGVFPVITLPSLVNPSNYEFDKG